MGVPLFGQEHVDRYRATDGEEGHDWQGTTVLLLTTTGRNPVARRTTPLIYRRHGDAYLVVASNGGGDPPGWFVNLQDDPIGAVQVEADHHTVRARVATAAEKPELWRIMTATGAPYDEFQAKADREIPVWQAVAEVRIPPSRRTPRVIRCDRIASDYRGLWYRRGTGLRMPLASSTASRASFLLW